MTDRAEKLSSGKYAIGKGAYTGLRWLLPYMVGCAFSATPKLVLT